MSNPEDPKILSMLTELCVKLGSSHQQGEVMAAQLLKRARQRAMEENCSETEALDYLIRLTIAGRQGITLDENPEKPPRPASEAEKNKD